MPIKPCPDCRRAIHDDYCPANMDRLFWLAVAAVAALVSAWLVLR